MTRQYIIQLICFNVFYPIFLCFADDSTIDQRINELKLLLKQWDQEQEQDSVDSQGYMIADWPKYADKIDEVKYDSEERRKIIQQIEELEKQKIKNR